MTEIYLCGAAERPQQTLAAVSLRLLCEMMLFQSLDIQTVDIQTDFSLQQVLSLVSTHCSQRRKESRLAKLEKGVRGRSPTPPAFLLGEPWGSLLEADISGLKT